MKRKINSIASVQVLLSSSHSVFFSSPSSPPGKLGNQVHQEQQILELVLSSCLITCVFCSHISTFPNMSIGSCSFRRRLSSILAFACVCCRRCLLDAENPDLVPRKTERQQPANTLNRSMLLSSCRLWLCNSAAVVQYQSQQDRKSFPV